jgi:hypothetical protein
MRADARCEEGAFIREYRVNPDYPEVLRRVVAQGHFA